MMMKSSPGRFVCVTYESKLPIFQPSRTPKYTEEWEGKWGTASVSVRGKLGQGHRDVLDSLWFGSEAARMSADETLRVLIDPYRLRRHVSSGRSVLPYEHVTNLLRDLVEAEVDIDIPPLKLHITDGILSGFEESPVTKPPPKGAEAIGILAPRHMLQVSFTRDWTQLLKSDLKVNYSLKHVIGLRHGASQAIARYCLSNKDVNDTLDGLFEKVRYDTTGKTRSAVYKTKAEIRSDRSALHALGITITETDTVHRKAPPVNSYGR